jgi:signal transduction histidine kinase
LVAPTPRRRPRLTDTDAWPVEIVTWFVVVFASVALYSVTVPLDAAVYGVHVAVAFGIGLLQAGALPLAMRWPWVAVAAFLIGQALFLLLGATPSGAPWPMSAPQMILLAILVALLAWRGSLRPALALWLGAIVVPLALAFLPDRGATPDGVVANLVTSAGIGALALGAGWLAQAARTRVTTVIDEERRVSADEHERRLIAEERTRIARELHDVVAHRMSIIQVQATSAPYRLAGLDEPTTNEFGEIAGAARAAMAEMRELLTVLRDPGSEAETAPQPGYDDLPELIASVERAGLPVTAELDPTLRGDSLTGRVAYRIVQESLSNVLRHAPGATTAIVVRATGVAGGGAGAAGHAGGAGAPGGEGHAGDAGGAVSVVIENGAVATGHGAADASAGGRPGASADPGEPAQPGAPLANRHGLIGMRERARLVGGTIEVGPTPLGGFRVHAVLPMSAPREDS